MKSEIEDELITELSSIISVDTLKVLLIQDDVYRFDWVLCLLSSLSELKRLVIKDNKFKFSKIKFIRNFYYNKVGTDEKVIELINLLKRYYFDKRFSISNIESYVPTIIRDKLVFIYDNYFDFLLGKINLDTLRDLIAELKI